MQQRCRSFRLFTLYAYISGTLALYALNFLKLQDLQEFVQELQDSCNLKNAYRQHTVSINGAYADSRIDKRMRFFQADKRTYAGRIDETLPACRISAVRNL